MVFNQHTKFCTRFAILFLITSTTVLYYITNKKDSVSLRTPFFYKKHITPRVADRQYFNSVNKLKTGTVNSEKLEKFDGKVYSFGNGIEKIKLAVVLCGERLNQTVVTLKSAVMFSRNALHFIIIVDDKNHALLKEKLLEWPSNILDRLSFEIHPINFPNGSEGDEWKKLFKPCACQRLFLPSVLHHIDSLLYVDTDVLFLRPVEELWEYFYKMNSSQIAALCPEHEDFATGWYNRFARHPFYEPLGVNSGVMLMNLTRMRTFQWETYLPSIMKEYRLNIVWGDQDIINIIFHFHPEKLYLFPCEWNFRPDHCMYSSICKTAEKNGIAVIHGNRGVFLNDKQPAFKAIFQAMLQYNLEDDPLLHFLEPVKLYLKQTINTNCGKYLSAIISRVEPKPLGKTAKR